MNNFPQTQSSSKPRKNISVGKAILIGQLVVNMPVFIIILIISSIGIFMALVLFAMIPSLPYWAYFLGIILPVIIGASVGWLWWSFSVPRWRRWALQNGAPEDQLQKWAVLTGLVWPKGWIFEKTEFKLKD